MVKSVMLLDKYVMRILGGVLSVVCFEKSFPLSSIDVMASDYARCGHVCLALWSNVSCD